MHFAIPSRLSLLPHRFDSSLAAFTILPRLSLFPRRFSLRPNGFGRGCRLSLMSFTILSPSALLPCGYFRGLRCSLTAFTTPSRRSSRLSMLIKLLPRGFHCSLTAFVTTFSLLLLTAVAALTTLSRLSVRDGGRKRPSARSGRDVHKGQTYAKA